MTTTILTMQEAIRAPIPLRAILPWAVFAGLLCLFALYLVSTEQGALSLLSGMYLHDFVHDGRHVIGVPCH